MFKKSKWEFGGLTILYDFYRDEWELQIGEASVKTPKIKVLDTIDRNLKMLKNLRDDVKRTGTD